MGSEFRDGEILLDEKAVAAGVTRIASQIDRDYAGKSVLFIGILKGSFVFLADLVRAVSVDSAVEFMAVSSYSGTSSTGEVSVVSDVGCDIAGRHVIVVEDILDTGLTLAAVLRLLGARSPASIATAVLLVKDVVRQNGIHPEYAGFEIENRFVVGYGLDCDGRYRGLPFVAALDTPADLE